MFRFLISMIFISVMLSGCEREPLTENRHKSAQSDVKQNNQSVESGNEADNNSEDIQTYNLGITNETLKQIELDATELSPQQPVLNIKEKALDSTFKVKGNVLVKDDWLENPRQSLDGAEVGVELKFDQ